MSFEAAARFGYFGTAYAAMKKLGVGPGQTFLVNGISGRRAANVGAVMEMLPLNAFWLMTNRIGLQGSVWFTTGEGEEMAAMAAAGTLDLSPLEHRIFPLSQVNEALAAMDNRDGSFSNFVVDPTRVD